jgi:hypothetical protein
MLVPSLSVVRMFGVWASIAFAVMSAICHENRSYSKERWLRIYVS